MREALDIKPYDFYDDASKLAGRIGDIFLLIIDGELIGAVSCIGGEVDDLIVHREYRCMGYGGKILRWAVGHILDSECDAVTLNVAEWNVVAVKLYRSAGFEVVRRIRVR